MARYYKIKFYYVYNNQVLREYIINNKIWILKSDKNKFLPTR